MDNSVVIALPRFAFGGAERVASDLMGYFARGGGRAAVLAFAPIAAGDSSGPWFAPYGPVHGLERRAGVEAVLALLDAADADALVLCGTSPAYRMLPALNAARPALRIAGFVFNANQALRETRTYAPFLDAVLVESYEAARAVAAGVEGALPIEVISSGVPARRLAARVRPARGKRLVVGFVGRFDRTKNPEAFVAMARALGGGFDFVMAGPAPARFRAPGIALKGLLLGEALEALLDTIDILVVPSRNDGRPLIVQEAQAMGIAVVASRVGGIPELVEHERTGLLVPPGDVGALAAAVRRMAEDVGLRDRLVEAARQRVLAEGELATVLPRYAAAITGTAVSA